MQEPPDGESGWLADYIFRGDDFQPGVAMFADEEGFITRFSSEPADLGRAQRLKNRAILPGLINAHSHAFQRTIRGRTEQGTAERRDNFWTWRDKMYHAANRLAPEDVFDSARMAFLEMLVAGVTSVGEFHYLHNAADGTRYDDPNLLAGQVIRAAQETGIRLVLLNAAYLRAGWDREPNPQQLRFLTPDLEEFLRNTGDLGQSSGQVTVGIAPHSLRAVPTPFLLEAVRYARTRSWPVHMHVAEQPAEITACQAEHGLRPVELLERLAVLGGDFTAVHATHTTGAELASLAEARANICVCPTTERNLGDGIARADEWAQTGINVCFGSDSNVQIDLLEDARELEYHLRLTRLERNILEAGRLFEYATKGAARSLALPGGELAVGRPADFFTVDMNDLSLAGADAGSLLTNVIFTGQRTAIREVYIGGRPVITEGCHREQERIVARFIALQDRLWR